MSFYDVELTVTIRARSLDEAIRLVSNAVYHGDETKGIESIEFSPRSHEVPNA